MQRDPHYLEVRVVYVLDGENLTYDVRVRDHERDSFTLIGLGGFEMHELHTLFGAPGLGEASSCLEEWCLAQQEAINPFP